MGMKTNGLEALIEATSISILDEWTAEAQAIGSDVADYIGDQLEAMEETEPEVCTIVGRIWLGRLFAA